MRVVARPPQSGKTQELIRIAAEEGGYIVCPTHGDVARVFQRAQEMGRVISYPLTFEEWRTRRYYGAGVKQLLFDDLDRCIALASAVPVRMVSLTTDGDA